jgi:small conductance mechanosensitive channel
MDKQIATIGEWVDVAKAFLVTYSFQILGAIIFLLIGLKVSAWLAGITLRFAQRQGLDITIATFASNVVRVAVIGLVVIATLGNFGISISALVAMVGAGTFGATLAIQGTLSNYGAGLSLVINRPFAVGDNISVKGVSGIVEEITPPPRSCRARTASASWCRTGRSSARSWSTRATAAPSRPRSSSPPTRMSAAPPS